MLPLCYLRIASKSINICKNIIYGKMIPLSVKPGVGVKVFLTVYLSLVSTSFSRLCFVISFGTFICNFVPYGYSSTFLNINRQSISEISFKMWLFFTIGLVHVSIGPPINGGEKKTYGTFTLPKHSILRIHSNLQSSSSTLFTVYQQVF